MAERSYDAEDALVIIEAYVVEKPGKSVPSKALEKAAWDSLADANSLEDRYPSPFKLGFEPIARVEVDSPTDVPIEREGQTEQVETARGWVMAGLVDPSGGEAFARVPNALGDPVQRSASDFMFTSSHSANPGAGEVWYDVNPDFEQYDEDLREWCDGVLEKLKALPKQLPIRWRESIEVFGRHNYF